MAVFCQEFCLCDAFLHWRLLDVSLCVESQISSEVLESHRAQL